jgi:hypothetical protein
MAGEDECFDAVRGWGTVCWIEDNQVQLRMEKDQREQRVPVEMIQTPEEIPQEWAAHILGMELGPSLLHRETGRMRSGLFVRNSVGKSVKLSMPGVGCDGPEPYTIDRGSALGVVYYDRGDDLFTPMRFMGVGTPPVNLEEERDAAALYGKVWGPVFARTWANAKPYVTAIYSVNPDYYRDISIEALRGVTVPDGVSLCHFDAPVGTFKIDGDKIVALQAATTYLGATSDPHSAKLGAEIQRILDNLSKPSVLAIYYPPVPQAIEDGIVRWIWRTANTTGTTAVPYDPNPY